MLLQTEKINQYLQQLRDTEVAAAGERDAFLKEIDSQKALADLYKRYFEEAANRADEAANRVTQANEAHAARVAALQNRLQAQAEEAKKLMEKMQVEYEEKIRELSCQMDEQMENTRVFRSADSHAQLRYAHASAFVITLRCLTCEYKPRLMGNPVHLRVVQSSQALLAWIA